MKTLRPRHTDPSAALLADLSATTDPTTRTDLLKDLAAVHRQDAATDDRNPWRALLLDLVAESEQLLRASWTAALDLRPEQRIRLDGRWWVVADRPQPGQEYGTVEIPVHGGQPPTVDGTEPVRTEPEYEPTGEAWQDNRWWQLATTRDRTVRAALLEEIAEYWAAPRFGADAAAILRDVAATERAAATRPARAKSKTADIPGEPDLPVRDVLAWAAPRLIIGAVGAALVAVVAFAPDYRARVAAGAAVVLLVLAVAALKFFKENS